MRIISENSNNYIHSLAVALSKDPASLESWRCLHVAAAKNSAQGWSKISARKLKEAHGEIDCDLVQCGDDDIFLVSRSLHASQLYEIADELLKNCGIAMEGKAEMALFDLFHDWRAIQQLLNAKSGESFERVHFVPSHSFGEISSLMEVFAEAKKQRKVRLPLHVMLVEDDPLTRRMVSCTFKEKYALITATNAEEAVANYMMYAPDIVFLDIGLPDANGFDVLKRIMESDPEAYVVMFSANSYLDNVTTALDSGASGFVAKPFKKEKMQHYIEDSALHHHKYA